MEEYATSHAEQKRAPESFVNVVASQGLQAVCEDAGWCHPGGHSAQRSDLSDGANRPAEQSVQLAVAAAAANRPTEQSSHVAAPEEEDRPAAHGLQRLVLPAENLPESQFVHSVAPVTLLVAMPGSHVRQLSSWAEGAYFPSSHFLHI